MMEIKDFLFLCREKNKRYNENRLWDVVENGRFLYVLYFWCLVFLSEITAVIIVSIVEECFFKKTRDTEKMILKCKSLSIFMERF